MKETFKKISGVCKLIFGYGIMISLFAGGLTFFGYLAALIIGGNVAALICAFIYKKIINLGSPNFFIGSQEATGGALNEK